MPTKEENYLVFVDDDLLTHPSTTMSRKEALEVVAEAVQDGASVNDIYVYRATLVSVVTDAVTFSEV